MQKTKIQELAEFGQSIWLDNIDRWLIESGRLKELIDNGLRGLTSNPTIFDKAISKTGNYDAKICELSNVKKTIFEIYDDLTVRDIQEAADLFLPVYEKTNYVDGYVSLEVDPRLAFKVEETVNEGMRLFKKVNRPNLMLKIPATEEGFLAVEELVAQGMNVNVTLIFSIQQYIKTTRAFLNGLAELSKKGTNLSKVNSVASVFVSRVDTLIDKMLDEKIANKNNEKRRSQLFSLKGKAAVANAKMIFQEYQRIFNSVDSNIGSQRLLWASTGTKNPIYSDIKYVSELIGKNSVNTIPDNTLESFLDHGVVREVITVDVSGAENTIKMLKEVGIDIDSVCAQLFIDGLKAFEDSFNSLLTTIESKSKQLIAQKI